MSSAAGNPILVVEDRFETLEAVAALLRHHGFLVKTATDGQEVIDLLEGGLRPTLMLIDLMMPSVSGWELLEYLRQEPELRHVPTVVMTAAPREKARVVADRVLAKPVDPDELVSLVRGLVALRAERHPWSGPTRRTVP